MICLTLRQTLTCSTLEVCHTLGPISGRERLVIQPQCGGLYSIASRVGSHYIHGAGGELSAGYLQVDSFVFPPSVWTSGKSTWSLLGSAVVQRRTGF